MAAPTHTSIIKDIKAGKFAPVYLLHGDEPFFIEQIAEAVEQYALTESERVFNQMVLYGKDVDARTVIDYCRQYPMMAQYRVIILKEAQMMHHEAFQALETYIEKSAPTTILVICYMHKKVDGRTSMAKTAKAKALVFESKKPYDNQIPEWIVTLAKSEKMEIDEDAVNILNNYVGNDLQRLTNEIQKLKIGLKGDRRITAGAVADNIGINREYNVFALQKAVGLKNFVTTELILQNLTANMKSSPFVMIIGSFFSYFTKLLIIRSLQGASDQDLAQAIGQASTYYIQEYKDAAHRYQTSSLEKIIGIIRVYDMKSKGFETRNQDEREMLREMVQRIFFA